jgi:hypothetical protein
VYTAPEGFLPLMTAQKRAIIALACAAAALTGLVGLAVAPYGGNVSALLHMDVPFGELHGVPEGVVLYQDAAYDGMLYYQVARDLPALFSGQTPSLDSPYRFQRVLLPALTYALSFGNQTAFPWVMLGINMLCVLAAFALAIAATGRVSVHAAASVLNPAVAVGVLFSLTEPLSLMLVMAFFLVWKRNGERVDAAGAALLTLSMLARETTIFLIAMLLLWSLWKRRWKDALLLLVPVAVLFGWQYWLTMRLGGVPFQANGNTVDLPLVGPASLAVWLWQGLTAYRLSALALLVFLAPLCVVLLDEWRMKMLRIDAVAFLVSGLAFAMLCMDSHMWGAITSIGRVVTPFYPAYVLYAAGRDKPVHRVLSWVLLALSAATAVGIALSAHPFTVS